jgi:hypothetical protein
VNVTTCHVTICDMRRADATGVFGMTGRALFFSGFRRQASGFRYP